MRSSRPLPASRTPGSGICGPAGKAGRQGPQAHDEAPSRQLLAPYRGIHDRVDATRTSGAVDLDRPAAAVGRPPRRTRAAGKHLDRRRARRTAARPRRGRAGCGQVPARDGGRAGTAYAGRPRARRGLHQRLRPALRPAGTTRTRPAGRRRAGRAGPRRRRGCVGGEGSAPPLGVDLRGLVRGERGNVRRRCAGRRRVGRDQRVRPRSHGHGPGGPPLGRRVRTAWPALHRGTHGRPAAAVPRHASRHATRRVGTRLGPDGGAHAPARCPSHRPRPASTPARCRRT